MQSIDLCKLGFTHVECVRPIYTGLMSVNYYIKCEQGEFLVKQILNNTHARQQKLLANLNSSRTFPMGPHFLRKIEVEDGCFFIFNWVHGKHILLDKLSPQNFKEFLSRYMEFISAIKENAYTQPAYALEENLRTIPPKYPFVQQDMDAILQDLSNPVHLQVIHGDFHFKNILFQDGHLKALLDFEDLRFGCPTEDLMYLLISNTERHLFYHTKRTLKLLEVMMEQTPFSKQDWLRGLDVYIVKRYSRKLAKKHLTLYKRLALWRNSMLYRHIRRFICGNLSPIREK